MAKHSFIRTQIGKLKQLSVILTTCAAGLFRLLITTNTLVGVHCNENLCNKWQWKFSQLVKEIKIIHRMNLPGKTIPWFNYALLWIQGRKEAFLLFLINQGHAGQFPKVC